MARGRYSINDVHGVFWVFHQGVRDSLFHKGKKYHLKSERELLPNIRFLLLGRFGSVLPEHETSLFSNYSGKGYFDFLVPGVAIEVAVRGPHEHKSKLTAYTNRDERRKLAGRDSKNTLFKRGVLVLLDFSGNPLEEEQLEKYRSKENLDVRAGLTNFSVIYYSIGSDKNRTSTSIRKNIRF